MIQTTGHIRPGTSWYQQLLTKVLDDGDDDDDDDVVRARETLRQQVSATSEDEEEPTDDAKPIPTLRWFETDEELFVRVLIKKPDAEKTKVQFTPDGFTVDAVGEDGDTLRRQAGTPIDRSSTTDPRRTDRSAAPAADGH